MKVFFLLCKRDTDHFVLFRGYFHVFPKICFTKKSIKKSFGSVGDPDPEPDPQDPHVFGPPGSGGSAFISQRYGSGSGSRSFPFLIDVLSRLKIMPTK
jgi:hypothetical protein